MPTKSKTWAVIALAASLSLAGLASGCGNMGHNANKVKTQSYGDDGFLGRTNSYPKIPSRHMALNYDNDYKLMTQSIKGVPGVTGAKVTFNGADAYVTVKTAKGLKANEIPTVERQVASVLRFNFPRYNIHVQTAP
ncbi:hypothetical protein [Cohnella nanjingensis]|uniref:Sporulation protein n=1 Tax=Cohnella nanjingensis TaxID=1387779 RepID=A0A7X0VJ30_9BACL|nr:hypothetical protein [Cohnella nanjingensis]MBB6675566.1 hypothetical protein [Cohnella nanjingensis]